MAQKDNRSYYDEFSEWYERERHDGYHRVIDDLQVDLLRQHVRDRDVLEVGCGTGLLLHRIEDLARSARGIDISPGMLELARERGLQVEEGCATELPFASATFDVVYSFKVLAHVRDIERAVAECSRVVRPGGILLLEFYNPLSLRFLAKRLAGPRKISESTRESAVYTRWDAPEKIVEYLPPEVDLEGWSGVRIFTPMAAVYEVPIVADALRAMEFAGRDTALGRFGGFLVARARKKDFFAA